MATKIFDEQCAVCTGRKVVQVKARFGEEGEVIIRPETFDYVLEANESIVGCHCIHCGIQYFKI